MFSQFLFGVLCLVLVEESVALNETHSLPEVKTFEEFKLRFQKVYKNETMEAYRKKCFELNMIEIDDLRKEFPTMKFGVNALSDLCDDEFNEMYRPIPDSNVDPSLGINTLSIEEDDDEEELQGSLDYRKVIDMVVTNQNVKGLGSCGGCYAFAADGVMEAHLALHKDMNVVLSKQHIIDCMNADTGYDSDGCDGGFETEVYDFIQKYGTFTEEEYPFRAAAGECRSKTGTRDYYVKSLKWGDRVSDKAIMNILKNHGPVTAIIQSDGAFKFYGGGIIEDMPYNDKPNHGVMLVGFGEENGIPFWIGKNSWGEEWGDKGYFYLRRGMNIRAVNKRITYPILE